MTRRPAPALRRMAALAVAGLVALHGAGASAAPPGHGNSASAVGTVGATVIQPIGVQSLADMEFGTITHAPGSGGTVTVTPGVAGAQFGGTASTACAGAACDTAHVAAFSISGEPARSYAVTLPSTINATGDQGNGTLTVQALTLRSINGGANPRLDGTGHDRLEVGGTITLPADLPAAHYRASFAVTVNYI